MTKIDCDVCEYMRDRDKVPYCIAVGVTYDSIKTDRREYLNYCPYFHPLPYWWIPGRYTRD
jgi:hypothetical protein